MKNLFLFLLFFILVNSTFGSHVIGYDMALVNIKDASGKPTHNYKFKLNFYRDITGIPIPTSFTFTIKRNDTHALIQTINLTKTNPQTFLTYDPENCPPPQANLRQEFGIYESPEINGLNFTATAGYYIYVEHNARNTGIKNVLGPSDSYSILMTMEFSALYVGYAAYNTSPTFNKKALNFFTVGKPYSIDMQVVDIDGDSLVYSLAQPLDAGSNKPFSTIPYAVGYNLNYNIIDGVPDLTINRKTGIVNFIPTQIGRYLIAFKVEEYRKINGVQTKIGEVRREMQIETVILLEYPPKLTNSKDSLSNNIIDTISIGEKYSLNFKAKDSPNDSIKMYILPRITPGENVLDTNIFDTEWGEPGLLQSGASTDNLVISGVGTLYGQFNFTPTCRNQRNLPYEFQVVVKDKTCPAPYTDTFRVKLYVTGKANNSPVFISPPGITANKKTLKYYTTVGDSLTLSSDSIIKTYDNDSLQTVVIKMLASVNNGSTFNNKLQFNSTPGLINSTSNFGVKITCSDVRPEPYLVKFIAYDDYCVQADTTEFSILVYVKSKNIPITDVCAVTIDSTNTKYSVYWDRVDTTIVKRYSFMFFNSAFNRYDEVYTVPNNKIQFFEFNVVSLPSIYIPLKVKLASLDECGFRTPYGKSHGTVNLLIAPIQNNKSLLFWNPLEGTAVKSYKIWKSNNSNSFELLDSVDASALTYIDSNSNPAKYKIEVQRFDTCAAFSNRFNSFSIFSNTVSNNLLSINKIAKSDIKVYPNPSKSILNIDLNNSDFAESTLFNAQGMIVSKQRFKEKCSLNVQDLPSGIYLLKVSTNNGSFVEKIIKE